MTNCLSDADDEAALHPTAIYLLPSSRAQREGLTTRGEFSSRGEGGLTRYARGYRPNPAGCPSALASFATWLRSRAIASRSPCGRPIYSRYAPSVEPAVPLLGHTRFPVVHIRPHCHLS